MAREQTGICAEGNLHSQYLLFNCNEGLEEAIRHQLIEINHYLEEMTDEYSDIAFSGFVAIGSNYWQTLYGSVQPKLLRPFPSITHDDRSAPVFPLDLFIQIRCDRSDINHLVSREICLMLEDLAELTEETRGFRYLDNRDLTGFVDGTENPKGNNRQTVALVGDEDKDFKGGSYIHIQRYVHDLSRTSLKDDDGNAIEILRQSMPYGDMKEQGLFFISCCKTPLNFELMLESMIVGDEKGHYDHLLKYTQAVTGAAFFAPSVGFFTLKNQ